uniref:Uncharacterized protein n=1 Tax=Oryza rufipogon TaxID=4529 RepID=A0A0E0PJS5_ORYRU
MGCFLSYRSACSAPYLGAILLFLLFPHAAAPHRFGRSLRTVLAGLAGVPAAVHGSGGPLLKTLLCWSVDASFRHSLLFSFFGISSPSGCALASPRTFLRRLIDLQGVPPWETLGLHFPC